MLCLIFFLFEFALNLVTSFNYQKLDFTHTYHNLPIELHVILCKICAFWQVYAYRTPVFL